MNAPGTPAQHADESRPDLPSRQVGSGRSSAPVRWMSKPSKTTLEAALRPAAAPETPEKSDAPPEKREEPLAEESTEAEVPTERPTPPSPTKAGSAKEKPKRAPKTKPAAGTTRRATKKR